MFEPQRRPETAAKMPDRNTPSFAAAPPVQTSKSKPYSPPLGILYLPGTTALPDEIAEHFRFPYPMLQALNANMGRYELKDGSRRTLLIPIERLKGVAASLNATQIDCLRIVYQAKPFRNDTFYERISAVFGAQVALGMQVKLGHKEMLGELQLTDNELSADAFVEQLTNRSSYMNGADLDSTNTDIDERTGKKRSNFQGEHLLSYFGFDSELPVFGEWGFQMRVFTPRPDARLKDDHAIARRKALNLNMPIVVFRGTEGIQFNTGEGGVDTLVGDTARAAVGFLQYKMNQERIEGAIKNIKSGVFAGHSLGGGIAQIVAALYHSRVNRVVTFQSPAAPAALTEQFAKADKPESHHYRVAGDIVPVAGDKMLPGSIQYFTRAQKNKGAKQFESAVNITASHVAFPLTTLLQGQDKGTLTGEQQAILKFGAHDRGEAEEGSKARMVMGNIYDTEKDPRKGFEWARANIASNIVEGVMGYNTKMAEDNLGYNLLLEEAGPQIREADTYEKFKAFCDWLKSVRELRLSQRQEKFLLELGIPNPNSALRGALGKTFLDRIYQNNEMVEIRERDYTRITENLPIHWANEHGGKRLPQEWKRAYLS